MLWRFHNHSSSTKRWNPRHVAHTGFDGREKNRTNIQIPNIKQICLIYNLILPAYFQSVFQETPSHLMLQHDAVHIQHVDNAQRESEHALLVPDEAGHVRLCRETSHAGAISR